MKKITFTLILILLLSSCVKVPDKQATTSTPPLFVTSTLPPTRPGIVLPTPIPSTSTPEAETTGTPHATSASCHDSALLVEDVTIPDNTRINAGDKFTKTWKLQNAGTCTWKGYTVAFVSGDRMDSPDSVPVPETQANSTVEVSVDLVAPTTDSTYRGNFELRNANGETVPIGTEPTFWVQIIVGAGGVVSSSGTSVAGQSGNCNYATNDGYVQTLIDLINKARTDVGRKPLTINDKLMKAAQAHSLDMACNNFMHHSGSDGTWVGDRLLAVGYANPYYLELLAIGLPQDAMNQWRLEKDQWDMLLNSRVTEIGAGYVYSKFSSYGSYWTVNMGGP